MKKTKYLSKLREMARPIFIDCWYNLGHGQFSLNKKIKEKKLIKKPIEWEVDNKAYFLLQPAQFKQLDFNTVSDYIV